MKTILTLAAIPLLALIGGCATPSYVAIENDGLAIVEPTFYPYYYGGVRVWIDPFNYYYRVGGVIHHYHDYNDVIVSVVPSGFYVIDAAIHDDWYRQHGYWRDGHRWRGEHWRQGGYHGNRGRDEVRHRGGWRSDYGRRGGHRIDNAPEPQIRQRQQRLIPPEPPKTRGPKIDYHPAQKRPPTPQVRPQVNLAPPKIHQTKPAPRMSTPRQMTPAPRMSAPRRAPAMHFTPRQHSTPRHHR